MLKMWFVGWFDLDKKVVDHGEDKIGDIAEYDP